MMVPLGIVACILRTIFPALSFEEENFHSGFAVCAFAHCVVAKKDNSIKE